MQLAIDSFGNLFTSHVSIFWMNSLTHGNGTLVSSGTRGLTKCLAEKLRLDHACEELVRCE